MEKKRLKSLPLLSFGIIFLLSCKDQIREEKKSNNEFYDKAFEYRERGMADSAYIYFNKSKESFLRQKDSLGIGKCLVNMGMIATDKGDYFGAQEISLSAIPYFNQKNEHQFVYISSNFNNLGMTAHFLLDYTAAIKFYDLAINYSRDSLAIRVDWNNKARIYQDLKEYKTALKIYNSILKGAEDNKIEYARALTNISYNKWLQDSNYDPIPHYLKALHIRQEGKDLPGQNSSYTHLVEYYAKSRADSALFYAHKRYQIAKEINSPTDKRSAIKELIRFSPENETKKYFDSYQKLDDSLQTARWNAKNQFALIRYETEKHKADFLKSEAENAQKKISLLIQKGIVAILLLSLLLGFFWYRKRKKILEQEKELEIKNTELKYVKKIHDRVANKVYHVMSEVENNPHVNRDTLLDKLEALYNISRDISYESKELMREGNYAGQLSEMLQSYSSEFTEVLIVGNEEELWKDIDEGSRTELFTVMQELMTNMRKHSKAETVVLKFQRNDSNVSILYSDNGVGMKDATKKNGLTNTENRIKNIRGTITFDNTLKEGLVINLSFPFP